MWAPVEYFKNSERLNGAKNSESKNTSATT